MKNTNAQVIVVGGGIIGAAVTYSLAKEGVSALLVEKSGLASGTAGATDGYITYHTKKAGILLKMAMKSGSMFEGLSEELLDMTGIDIEYEKDCGSLQVLDREEEWSYVAQMVQEQRDTAGLDIAMHSIEELRRIEPALNPSLVGGLYSPSASKVNPIKTVLAYAKAAKMMGARIIENAEVTGIIADHGHAKGVNTTAGDFYADYVVNAAGTWGGKIAALAGLQMPIKPRRGQIFVTELLPALIHGTMQCGRTTAIKINPEMLRGLDQKVVDMGMGFCIEQTMDGSVLIGFTREFAGFDRSTTLDAIELMAQRAVLFIPALCSAGIIRSFSGLRPYTPDGKPILGRVDGLEGFIMAAGHEGDGICLAPLTGKLTAELVADGRTSSFSIEEFSHQRFEKS